MTLWFAVAAAADLSWESPAQPAPVHLEAPVFAGPLIDTGWWPSAGDPLAVRFTVAPFGDLYVDADADSELAWPSPLWQRVVAVPDTGRMEVDAGIDMAAQVHIDIGIYAGDIDVWTDRATLRGEALFDGLLLLGHPTDAVTVDVDDPSLVPPVSYGISVITGVELVFELQTYPSLDATLTRGVVDGRFPQGETRQDTESAYDDLAIDGAPALAGELEWSADLDGGLDVVFEPALVLDTVIGDFQLLSFPLPVNVVALASRLEADPAAVVHPLPVLDPLVTRSVDFGAVSVGDVAAVQLDLGNLGDLWLEGEARIDGDAALTVFPEQIAAASASADGVVVSFAPTAPGPFAAELVLVTNDPANGELRIPLTGDGVDAPTEPTEPPDPTEPTAPTTPTDDGVDRGEAVEAKGCGCAATPSLGAGWLALLLAAAARRRR